MLVGAKAVLVPTAVLMEVVEAAVTATSTRTAVPAAGAAEPNLERQPLYLSPFSHYPPFLRRVLSLASSFFFHLLTRVTVPPSATWRVSAILYRSAALTPASHLVDNHRRFVHLSSTTELYSSRSLR